MAPPPSPTALPFSEAIRTLKAVAPGDTTSALDLVLLSKLAASVNVNSLRGRAFLPHDASSAKKKETIVVFAEGELAEQARQEGADIIGGKELIDEIISGRIQPTKIIAAPDQLANITRSTLPRLLGPKGLMPSAKRGTVTSEISKAIREAKGGLDWLADSADKGMVSVPIARVTFTEDQIKTNLVGFAKQVEDVLNGVGTQAQVNTSAAGAKKKMGAIEKVYLSTSKSFSVEVTDFQQMLGH
ncbi:ribosomal protein L1 [Cystobasidium minutum MCA 4210]|uniref:mitochondrial 54S ribosomal protein uL1m n=1 Tax=Cystobasidium minutum MCA 4210 TaxID=1397322 RepID=UPI0034CE812F|eukprot:jgi/Rhomi1/142079/e_gw1.3.872.1